MIGIEILILNYIFSFLLYGIYDNDLSDENICNNLIDCQFNFLTNVVV